MLAQENEFKNSYTYPFTNYTIEDGLPSNETYYSLVDQKGYLWITTDKGVSRFNGYEFENFTKADGLIDNTLFNCYEDSKGRIWFVGYNSLLCYWDWEKKDFQPYEYNELLTKELKNREVSKAIIDLAIDENGRVYIGLQDNGYIIIDGDGGIEPRVNHHSTHDNVLFFGKKYFDHGYRNYSEIIAKNQYTAKFKIALCINDSCFYPNEEDYKLGVKMENGAYLTRNKNPITSFLYNEDLLVLNQYDLQYSNRQSLNIEPEVKYFMLEDSSMYQIKNNFLECISADLKYQKVIIPITPQELVAISQKDGRIYLTSATSGVFSFLKNDPILNIPAENYNASGLILHEENIIAIPEFKQITMLSINQHQVSTLNDIAFLDDIETSFNFYSSVRRMNQTHDGLNAFKAKLTHPKRILILASSQRLIVQNTRGETLEEIDSETRLFSLTYYNDKFLVGTDRGLMELQFDSILVPYELPNLNLNHHRIQDLRVHKKQLIVLTRGDGLYILGEKKHHITTQQGLNSNLLNHSYIENDILWVASNNGANAFELNEKLNYPLKHIISSSSGILSQDIRQILSHEGKLYLGCTNGISIINYNDTNKEQPKLPVYFTNISVNDTLKISNKDENIELKYHQNNISFDFTAVHQNPKERITYAYRLVGLDKQFKYTKERSIVYNNVPPGDYTFILQAKRTNEAWGSKTIDFQFSIAPPFWQTWWFRILAFFASIGLILVVFSLYVRNLQHKNKVLQKLNDLKQQALSSQMNPHFVFNSLNSIQNFMLTGSTDLANDYLVKFSKLIRVVFENSKTSYIPIGKEIEASRMYLDLEKLRNKDKFDYKFDIDSSVDLESDLIPSLLIQPFLENAVWHGMVKKEKKGVITMKINAKDKTLTIVIEDNGIGREASKKINRKSKIKDHVSSGLKITEERIDLVNAVEKFNFSYDVIDKKSKNGESEGTKIIFTIPKINRTHEKN